MAYNERMKNFECVRDYMRQFYVYGFKSRNEYDAKSARSYDNERRRIESWLSDYNIIHIAEYGRYDDLLVFMETPCQHAALDYIQHQLAADVRALETGAEVSLLAKWLPSVNASNAQTVLYAKRIVRSLGMTEKTYRKTLTKLHARIHIIENNLRERDYSFDYAKQPSQAMFKYRIAFLRNDGARYREFMSKRAKGETTLHTGSLTPYEIIAPFFQRNVSAEERLSIDMTWSAQEDFTHGENALAVIDGSGSMYDRAVDPLPATVALSLGIYFAERNTGEFHNHFITFSYSPQLVEMKGGDIYEKVRYCHGFSVVANTNLQKVFDLILNAAIKNHISQAEMPSTLYIISDMKFD